jgi:hypothetical protein
MGYIWLQIKLTDWRIAYSQSFLFSTNQNNITKNESQSRDVCEVETGLSLIHGAQKNKRKERKNVLLLWVPAYSRKILNPIFCAPNVTKVVISQFVLKRIFIHNRLDINIIQVRGVSISVKRLGKINRSVFWRDVDTDGSLCMPHDEFLHCFLMTKLQFIASL